MSRPPRLLLDSDFFVLIAGGSLMAPCLDSLGCAVERARRLAPLPHMLRRGRLTRRYPEGIREKALAWCEKITAVEDRPTTEPETYETLLSAVDPGEALLFSTVAGLDEGMIATGDKRACLAIARSSELSAFRMGLAGKIVTLEVALEALAGAIGFDALAEALVPVREFSRTLRLLLPRGSSTAEEHFREGLGSYLSSLRQELDDLLYSPVDSPRPPI